MAKKKSARAAAPRFPMFDAGVPKDWEKNDFAAYSVYEAAPRYAVATEPSFFAGLF